MCKYVNDQGLNATHLLSRRNAIYILDSLAKNGVDILKEDIHRETVLFHGLGNCTHYDALVKLYKDYHGDIDRPNKIGVI